MEENYWDWFEKQELEEHNTVPVDDIFRDNPKPVPIDSGVEGLVRTVRASSILTLGCCSGLLSDHYDISAIKAESTYTEFVKNIGISQGNGLPNKRPSLATAAFLHEENDDGTVTIAKEYHTTLQGKLIQTVAGDRVEWDVYIKPPLMYMFELQEPELVRIAEAADSFEEYDNIMSGLIDGLEVAIVSAAEETDFELDYQIMWENAPSSTSE